MKIRALLLATVGAFSLMFAAAVQSDWWPFNNNEDTEIEGDVVEILWDDLIPDDFVQPENPFNTMTQEEIDKLMDGSDESNAELARLEEVFNYAPVVENLDGKRVKIPAYITPLEYNADSLMEEFLLVPYVGACIHVPPPPANQIVHAKSRKAIKMNSIYDPVWAIGVIRAETIKSDLAESGYQIDVERILPYKFEEQQQRQQ
jgi:hypothetical protein